MAIHTPTNATDLNNILTETGYTLSAGDYIDLEPGVTYNMGSGSTLPAKGLGSPITIRSAGYDNWGKERFSRATLAEVSDMGTIGIAGNYALQGPQTAPGAYQFLGVNVANTNTGVYRNSGIYYGLDNTNSPNPTAIANLPTIVVRHCVFNNCLNVQFPLTLNCGSAIIESNYIGPISAVGYESKCIAGWSCFGPFLIQNNYLSGSTISMLLGGATNIVGHVPKGIFRCNHVYWDTSTHPGGKNLYEHKEGQGWVIEGNIFENFWVGGQDHSGIYNVGEDVPSHVERMVMRFNKWTNCETWVGAGFPAGYAAAAALGWRTRNYVYHDNLYVGGADPRDGTNSDRKLWGFSPFMRDVVIHHNTFIGASGGTKTNTILTSDDNVTGTGSLTVRDNIIAMGWQAGLGYMVVVGGVGYNETALNSLWAGGTLSFTNNAIAREDTVSYDMPAGNDYYTGASRVANMLAKLEANYAVKASQSGTNWNTYGSDGGRIGADIVTLEKWVDGVEDGEPRALQSGMHLAVQAV